MFLTKTSFHKLLMQMVTMVLAKVGLFSPYASRKNHVGI